MKTLTIKASPRKQAGSSASGRIRTEGSVPAVVYGKSKQPENLVVDSKELRALLRAIGNNAPVVQLKEGDKQPRTSIIKEVQRHPIKDTYIHVDFHEVSDDEVISISVPVHAVGEAYGVKTESGTMEVVSHTVHVRCLPKDIPSAISVDVTELKVGDNLHVSQLPAIEGVQYADNPTRPIFAVVK